MQMAVKSSARAFAEKLNYYSAFWFWLTIAGACVCACVCVRVCVCVRSWMQLSATRIKVCVRVCVCVHTVVTGVGACLYVSHAPTLKRPNNVHHGVSKTKTGNESVASGSAPKH